MFAESAKVTKLSGSDYVRLNMSLSHDAVTQVDRRSEEKQRRGTRSVWVSFPRLVLVFAFPPVCVVPRAQTRLALLFILSKFNLYLPRHTHNF